MLRPEALPQTQYDVVPLAGGFDQITPAYQLSPGALRDCVNFACRSQGGYYRIPGYERFDGRPSPHKADFVTVDILLDSGKFLFVGDEGSFGNINGTICYIDPEGLYVGLTKTTSTFITSFIPGPIIVAGDTKGQAVGIESALTLKTIAQIKASAANIYRADIQAVPGSGPISGVVYHRDTAFAFRNNAGGTQTDIHRSTVTGWQKVDLGQTVPFENLGAHPTEGLILTQSGVTAVIERWVITSGDVTARTASGYFLISGLNGGNFAAGPATFTGGTVDLTGAQADIVLQPNGKYNFSIGNFSAYYANARIYGADGVNDAFEFDGDIYVPIHLDMAAKPRYAVVHSNHLFLAVESSVVHSALGNPYNFEVINGAGEIGTGGLITGMLILPGNQGTAALEVTSRSSTWILYGTSAADWKFVNYNVGVGALNRTLQNLFDAFAADDHGITIMKQTLNYGNFDAARITYNIQRFIRDMQGQLACSALSRPNSQYRVFYSNGYGIYSTVTPSGLIGHGIVLFPDPVVCTFDGEDSHGNTIALFGTNDGYVMQNDVGTSFDGKKIGAYLNTNINTEKTPRLRKRFRRAVIEIQAENYVEAQFGYTFEWASPLILPHEFFTQHGDLTAMPFWDHMLWDSFYWDGKTDDAVPLNLEGTGENIQFVVVSESDYLQAFTLNSVLFHYTGRRGNR